MDEKRKILATVLMAIILVHSTGTIATIGIHNAFAYSNSTYEVENIIYFNATALGKSASQTIRLVISEDTEAGSWKPGTISTKADTDNDFVPNATGTSIGSCVGIMDRYNNPVLDFAGISFDFSSTSFGILNTWYNGTNILENGSEFFGENGFKPMTHSYPVIEKLVLFDSPYNYVAEWCDSHGYYFDAILNSTYTEYFDINTLNLFDSRLVKTDWMITENLANASEYMAMSALDIIPEDQDFGTSSTKAGELVPQDFGLSAIIAICIAAFFITPMICDAVLQSQQIAATAALANAQINADMNVTISAINAERDVQIELVTAKATNEALILEMLENGTLTFEEANALLNGIRSDYTTLLSNRTSNLVDALSSYYNHTEELWSDYMNGLAIGTSWTDYIQLIITFIIICFVIYVIYALFLRRKGLGGASNIYVVR